MTQVIAVCPDCNYRGLRFENNLVCSKCKGLMKIIYEEKQGEKGK